MKRVLLSWSSGKDSAWALHILRQQPEVDVVGLLTTFNESNDRAAMHGIRHELVQAQADSAGLPLWSIPLPFPCSNEEYEARMSAALQRARRENITHIAFADLFLFLLLLPGGCTTSNCSPAPCITWSLLIGYLTI